MTMVIAVLSVLTVAYVIAALVTRADRSEPSGVEAARPGPGQA